MMQIATYVGMFQEMIPCHVVVIRVLPSHHKQDTVTYRSQQQNMYQCVVCHAAIPVRHIAMHGVLICINMYGAFWWILYIQLWDAHENLRNSILHKLQFTTNLKSLSKKFKLLNANVLYSKVILCENILIF
jgi:hypothetical protein